MRCLTLGSILVERGWSVGLVGRAPDGLAGAMAAAGVTPHPLPDDIPLEAEPAWLGAQGLLGGVDVVVADGYGIGAAWQSAVAGGGRLIAAIDDLASAPMAVDLLLNQNLGASEERYRGLLPDGAVVLAGPRYALLRPAFAAERAAGIERDGIIRRILVFLSGADEDDVTSRAAAAVVETGIPADIVVGSAYPFLDQLAGWVSGHSGLTLHHNTPDMPRLMAAADLAIGAPSSASWERCTLGLPSILVVLAENQAEIGTLLDRAGAARTLGWHDSVSTTDMTTAITALATHAPRLRVMGRIAASIADGAGAARVADALDALVDDRRRRRAPGASA
jgi:UDP-2,4-diacetamido-2,4,6-trideoxy-beta-L-altropyranose hydrolase